MKIILDDGATFTIEEDSTSIEFFDKIIRIMKYMTFSDTTIAKGMLVNLGEMACSKEVTELINKFCEEWDADRVLEELEKIEEAIND